MSHVEIGGKVFQVSIHESFADSQVKTTKGQNTQKRPKSEKFYAATSSKNRELSSARFIQKNLDDYLLSLSNFNLKEKLERCPGSITECPVITEFREGLKKSVSNHVAVTPRPESRTCQTSRVLPIAKQRNGTENTKTSKEKSNLSEYQPAKSLKSTPSNTSRGVIRSTRAQDLRSQSNRDLLKPKTTIEKTRTVSPYLTSLRQKNKKSSCTSKSDSRSSGTTKSEGGKPQTRGKNDKNPIVPQREKIKKEKYESGISPRRQKTQEIINPKIVKKTNSSHSAAEKADGDSAPPPLKKSQTFFICKGTKNGEGDEKPKSDEWNPQNDSHSEGNGTDDEAHSPKLRPLTHNDSFCLIVKSSQNWSQKNRSDDEKWLHYGLTYEEKEKKGNDKGILKNSNHDLKSVDSLEKVDSEKIVRFSDELLNNKKVLKKLVRRKKRLQNFFNPNWYQKNKLFQKYFQILREKSVLLSERNETPEDLFQVPSEVKKRYEPEMCPRKGKFYGNHADEGFCY